MIVSIIFKICNRLFKQHLFFHINNKIILLKYRLGFIIMSRQYNQLSCKQNSFKFQLTNKYPHIGDQVGITALDELVLQSHDDKQNIFIVCSAQYKQKFSKKIGGLTTSFRMIDGNLAVIFDVSARKWCLINTQNRQIKAIDLENSQFWTDGQFQLEYFQDTNEICLIQKDKNAGKLKVCFYQYVKQNQGIKPMHSYESKQSQWLPEELVYTLNEKSCLGWCGSIKNDFKLKIYERYKGMKTLNLEVANLSTMFQEHQFKVKSLVKNAPNSYYLTIYPSNIIENQSNKSYSPLIYVKTSPNSIGVEQIDFLPLPSFNNSCISNQIDSYIISNYTLLKTYELEQNTITKCINYTIDNHTRQILTEEEGNYSCNARISVCSNRRNTLLECEFESQNCKEIAAEVKQIQQMNSLALQRMLIAISSIQSLSQKHDTAILIFGSNNSGKSTLRHFMAAHALVHAQNEELDFSELKAEIIDGGAYEHQAEKQRIIWISPAQNAVIIDIPDWNEQSEFFKAQTSIFVATAKQLFKKLHFVVTIPLEYIEESHLTINILSSVLEIVGDAEAGMAQFTNIVLTKVDDESSLQAFTDRNQDIAKQNQQLGEFLANVCNEGRLYNFINRQYEIDEGIQFRQKILNSSSLELPNQTESHSIFEDLFNQNPPLKDAILLQLDYLLTVFNKELQYISFSLTGLPQGYSLGELNSLLHYSPEKFSGSNEIQTSQIACALASFIVQLKLLATEPNNIQKSNKIKIGYKQITDLFQNAGLRDEARLLQEGFAFLTASLLLSVKLKINNSDSQPFAHIFKIYEEDELGILGNEFKNIIKILGQTYRQVQHCPQLKQIGSLLSETVVIKKQVPMTYEEERNHYLKKKMKENQLEVICRLPCNVLKLDLIMEELKPFSQKQVQDKDYPIVNFYLREASKICQYHELYFESLVFLAVLPDFIGIGIVLDDLIAKCRKDGSFTSKIFEQREVTELIDQLIILCRTCLRENLLHKLIHVKYLNDEFTIRADKIREYKTGWMRSNLPSREHLKGYSQKLREGKDLPFYNLRGDVNLKKQLGMNRENIIKKCRRFEETDGKSWYENVESINWLIQTSLMPN